MAKSTNIKDNLLMIYKIPPKQQVKKNDKSKTQSKLRPVNKTAAGPKKKKWSKGRVRDKLNYMSLFDKPTYEKLYKEVTSYKIITPNIVSERLKVKISLAQKGLNELESKNLIKCVTKHNMQRIYTKVQKMETSE